MIGKKKEKGKKKKKRGRKKEGEKVADCSPPIVPAVPQDVGRDQSCTTWAGKREEVFLSSFCICGTDTEREKAACPCGEPAAGRRCVREVCWSPSTTQPCSHQPFGSDCPLHTQPCHHPVVQSAGVEASLPSETPSAPSPVFKTASKTTHFPPTYLNTPEEPHKSWKIRIEVFKYGNATDFSNAWPILI